MFENFFLYGPIPANAETGTYTPLLVLASFIVASLGSYAGLTFAVQLFATRTKKQKHIVHWTGAFALGSGIWSMHFIGMLSYKMQMTVDYDVALTVISLLIAMAVAYCVLHITQAEKLSRLRLTVGSVLLGFGICAMHYSGMAAMEMPANLFYTPFLFFLSVAIAITASGAALWIVFTLGRHSGQWQITWRVIAALVMGAAICGMHYTGMAAAVFIPCTDCSLGVNQSSDILEAAVIVSTAILLCILAFTFSLRFFLIIGCGILFSLPLIAIVYQAITELDLNIHIAEREQYGVKYHNQLLNLLQRVQEVRGLTYVVHNGDATFAGMLQSKKEDMHHIIAAVDDEDRLSGSALKVDQNWQSVRKNILLPLEMQNPSQPAEEFKQYSEAIHSLTDFMEDVADNSNLSIDPQLDTDYLADAAINVTPALMETIGRMRGLTAGLLASGKAPSQWTEKETRELQALYSQLSVEDDDMENALERAKNANENSGQFIEYHNRVIEPKLEEFRKHFEQMIFVHANDLSGPETFKLATDVITLYDSLYDKTSDAFLDLLRQRQAQYALKRNLVLSSSVVAFLGFIALFVFLYRALAKTERAEQEAAAASQTKSEFLANMSHELRTPLNSILGMNRLLLESKLTEEQHGLVDTIFRSSVNLLEIVNDILDLSKIEAGEMRLEYIGFDPSYVFHGVAHALDHVAAEKRVPIVRHYEKETFPYVMGDPTRFGRILMNLIGNAIKYTDKGRVDIRVSCKELDSKHIELRCDITDTGIGIPKDKLKSIFEKFVQADTSTTRKYGGTGLGLAITKQLVELMGGRIGVISDVAKGSTFWFTIPFEITDKLHEEKHIRRQKALLGTIPPEKARILVAEDHPMNQLLIRKLLQKFGVENFRIVENGLDVLKACRESAWHIILMDCHMPEKNGYDATIDIRNLEKTTGAHIPIVAMTANAMVGDKEKCLRYGMDEYISKPINSDELQEILGQWIHFKNGAESDQTSPVPPKDALLDLSILRTFSEGDKEKEKKYIRVFVDQSEKNMKTLAEYSTNGDTKLWREAGHMFKGGALGIGANALAGLCEQAQHFEGTAQEQAELFENISREYGKVKDRLKELALLF